MTTFEYISVEPAYQRVLSEEGPYDAHVGYQLHVAVRNDNGDLDHYLHFHIDRDVEALAERVRAAGQINLEHWEYINTDHADRDYELEELQLAYRERMGLPL